MSLLERLAAHKRGECEACCRFCYWESLEDLCDPAHGGTFY